MDEARFRWTTHKTVDEGGVDPAPYVVDVPLAGFPCRQGRSGEQRYVRELKLRVVEFIADYELISLFVKKGNYTVSIAVLCGTNIRSRRAIVLRDRCL